MGEMIEISVIPGKFVVSVHAKAVRVGLAQTFALVITGPFLIGSSPQPTSLPTPAPILELPTLSPTPKPMADLTPAPTAPPTPIPTTAPTAPTTAPTAVIEVPVAL